MAVRCVADGVDGVAVDVGGDGGGAVAEDVGDVFEADTGGGQQAGRGLPQLVRVHVLESCLGGEIPTAGRSPRPDGLDVGEWARTGPDVVTP
jgi:hypothetical protein